MLVDWVEFSDLEDVDLRVAYCVQAHDQDANRFKSSSIRDLVWVAMRYKARTPGGGWGQVQKKLNGIYGQGRTMWVYRMIVAAETLPDPILRALEDVGIPNSYVHENNFFRAKPRSGPSA